MEISSLPVMAIIATEAASYLITHISYNHNNVMFSAKGWINTKELLNVDKVYGKYT